jgi:hypothetical protein
MSSSFAYEDPLLRQNLNTTQKTMEIFKDMGRGVLRSGKGFGKVGALYAGIECVIESVRRYLECFARFRWSLTVYLATVSSAKRHGESCRCWFFGRGGSCTQFRTNGRTWRWPGLRCVLRGNRSFLATGTRRVSTWASRPRRSVSLTGYTSDD